MFYLFGVLVRASLFYKYFGLMVYKNISYQGLLGSGAE